MTDKEDLIRTIETQTGESDALLEALNSREIVRGFTHNHYRYPARFSPEFVRECIQAFTQPRDLVLDPFMGGGTSGVEALAAGRRYLGSDVNELGVFASKAKTDLLSEKDEAALLGWISAVGFSNTTNSTKSAFTCRNVPWNLRRVVSTALSTLSELKTGRQRRFARCSILRTAQWALDCKQTLPTTREFWTKHSQFFVDMLAGHQEFSEAVRQRLDDADFRRARRLLCIDAAKLHRSSAARSLGAPKLVVTSPPYLGVHVLYHRWQVRGRRETPAPYWIAGAKVKPSGVYYTLADRRAKTSDNYYRQLSACLSSIKQMLDYNSTVVQLVAFGDSERELPAYLRVMTSLGFVRCHVQDLPSPQAPLNRSVPNRRWYALMTSQSRSSDEFLLVHKLKRKA